MAFYYKEHRSERNKLTKKKRIWRMNSNKEVIQTHNIRGYVLRELSAIGAIPTDFSQMPLGSGFRRDLLS